MFQGPPAHSEVYRGFQYYLSGKIMWLQNYYYMFVKLLFLSLLITFATNCVTAGNKIPKNTILTELSFVCGHNTGL